MKKKWVLIAIIVAIILGILIGRSSKHFATRSTKEITAEKKPLYWIDSMEPQVHYPGPGKSHMGMELVPVYPEDNKLNPENKNAVRISSEVIENLGIRTAPVLQGTLARHIEAIGYVEPDENKISHLHSYVDGWINKLFVKASGESVKKGQLLMQLYSPELVNAQEEYLIALESKNQNLINASYKKLTALKISEQQIQQIKKIHKASQVIDIYAPQDGIVAVLNIRQGMRVTPETEMMSLVDLTNIWIIAQIFEKQANWVKIGESAQAKLNAFPGKVWKGQVEYIYPQLDPTTRTLKVRFHFNNPDQILKPNMYASIALLAEPKQNVLNIPLEALIRSSQGDRVIVALSGGRFEVRPVTVGMESGDRVEILSGLAVNDQVVASGQFLLDSEVSLKTGLERLQTPAENANPEPVTKSNQTIEGMGIITAIDISKRTLTLKHQAIPALNWPAMTMDFSVETAVSLHDFKVGDPVQFNLKKAADHRFVITHIKKESN